MRFSSSPRRRSPPLFHLLPHALITLALLSTLLAPGAPLAAQEAEATQPNAEVFPTGRFVEKVACLEDPTQTYTLYLPSAYTAERPWPVLFIFDPRGRATRAAELFRPAAEAYGWILISSNDTRSDGPWEPNAKALLALWPEPHRRFRADPRRLYATGFSGGAVVAWVLAQQTEHLAGVISAGGRMPPELPPREARAVAHFGTVGDVDFNYREMHRLDEAVAAHGYPHRLEIFEGRHRWMPPELARQAMEWLEVEAMKADLRPRDAELITALFEADRARAKELETEGHLLQALRRFEAIERTFQGLLETAKLQAVQGTMQRLRKDVRIRRTVKEEARWHAFETRTRTAQAAILVPIERDPGLRVPASKLIRDLEIPDLRKRAQAKDTEGVVARRVLEDLWSRLSFYMTRDLLREKRFHQAESILTAAVEIRDDQAHIWYNLACAAARSGAKKKALQALQRAVDLGFDNLTHMAEDPDLASLRDEKAFQALVREVTEGPHPEARRRNPGGWMGPSAASLQRSELTDEGPQRPGRGVGVRSSSSGISISQSRSPSVP